MNNPRHSVVLVILSIFAAAPAQAQLNLSKWQIGVNGGIFIYQGDLTPSDLGSYKTVGPVAGIYVSRVLNPSLLLRTNLAIGKLKGDEAKYSTPAWRQQRNYSFTASVAEISELLVWNMFGNNGNELGQKFSPYLFAGVGANFFKTKRDYSNFNYHYFASSTNVLNGLAADSMHTLPRASLVLPIGLGMEYYLTPKLSLTTEATFRYTSTDYLDGFSLGANPDEKDFYHSITVGLVYRFGKRNQLDCPVMKR